MRRSSFSPRLWTTSSSSVSFRSSLGLDLLGQGKQRAAAPPLGLQLRDGVGQPLFEGLFLQLPALVLVQVIEVLAVGARDAWKSLRLRR